MRLGQKLYECAIDHVVEFGDTDVFPFPFERHFLSAQRNELAASLSSLDLANYRPMNLVESLVPKSRFGFRVAHQPFILDTVIFTAMVLSIYDDVEAGRPAPESNRAFSYRKKPGLDANFFQEDRTYRHWLESIGMLVFSDEYSHAIRTDISDFYMRIYRHRLENILSSLSGDEAAVRRIENFIADWRGRQSFGLPVGSNAARLLAEAALNDTDHGLVAEGYDHTRYVDDMIVLVRHDQDPYAALGYLAKQLAENEGLALNNQKTTIFTWEEFVSSIPGHDDGGAEPDEESTTERLFWSAYGNEEADEEALNQLMLRDLSAELEELLNEPYWDMGRIRIVLHAMRLVGSPEIAAYVRANLATLVPFAKDIALLVDEFAAQGIGGFDGFEPELTELLLSDRMEPLACSRAWLLELGVRGVLSFSSQQIRRLDTLTGTLDRRQLTLLRWRAGDVNYFRSRKTRLNEINSWSQPSFIFGARCLPQDEYKHWIRSIRSRLQFPEGLAFADWCLATYGNDPLR
ncbi:MAG: RNA-directed DNA polymerase [Pseudomonadota bacterium]